MLYSSCASQGFAFGLDSSARGMLGFPFSPLLSSSEQAVNIAAPIARMNNDRYDFFIIIYCFKMNTRFVTTIPNLPKEGRTTVYKYRIVLA
jgi:hypothetical protein